MPRHAGFSRSCFAVGAACAFTEGPPDGGGAGTAFLPPEDEIGVETWLVDVGGAIRLRDPARSRWWRPYLMLGWGAVAYDPDVEIAGIMARFVDAGRTEPQEDGTVRVIVDDTEAFLLAMDEVRFTTSFAWMLGAGKDLRLPLGERGRFAGGAEDFRTLEFDPAHNLRLTAGLVIEVPLR